MVNKWFFLFLNLFIGSIAMYTTTYITRVYSVFNVFYYLFVHYRRADLLDINKNHSAEGNSHRADTCVYPVSILLYFVRLKIK